MNGENTLNLRSPARLRPILVGLAGLVLLFLLVVFYWPQAPASVAERLAPLAPDFLAPYVGLSPAASEDGVDNRLRAAGIVQVEEVSIATEFGGRITAIPVAEGAQVARGDVLVQLDTALLAAQIEAARAAVALAEAGLAQVEAGARPGQIAVAEAQLQQAEAARLAATQVVSDTLALVENPQDIRLQIAVAQAQLVAVEHQVAQATALKDAAEVVKNKFEGVQGEWDGGSHQVLVQSGTVDQIPPEIADEVAEYIDGDYTVGNFELHIEGSTYELYTWVNPSLPLALHLAPNQWWQAWVGVNAATARQEGMESSLAHLYSQYNQPQSLEAKADEALAALAQAEAQIVAAQAQVDGLKAGANATEIAALEARVAQAQATLDSLLAQQALLQITSPMAGVVVDVMVHPGEVAAAGATLLMVADLSEVRLVVYLPQSQIGRVSLEQGVQVTVDAFPGRVFSGRIVHIADQAEFTPRNVATTEERANLVLAVEILLANEANALKPGMPAEAVFVEEAR